MIESMPARLLDSLIPAHGDLPGGSVALPALMADPTVADIFNRLAASEASDPIAQWGYLAEQNPRAASLVLHLLSAAYFSEPQVRAHYGSDVSGRPRREQRLADLLADVPRAPGLPYRTSPPREQS